MRVNVYAAEITDRIEIVTTEADTGSNFIGCRFLLKTHPDMMRPKHPDDDDSGVTFWVHSHRGGFRKGDASRLANIFESAAAMLREHDE